MLRQLVTELQPAARPALKPAGQPYVVQDKMNEIKQKTDALAYKYDSNSYHTDGGDDYFYP